MSDDVKASRLVELEAEVAKLRRELGLVSPTLRPARCDASSLTAAPEPSGRERQLMEAERIAHLGSWTWNLESDEIGWSDEFYRILGLDPRIVTPSAAAFFAAIHPDDVALVQESSRHHLGGGTPTPVEFRIVRPSGETRYLRMEGDFTDGPDGPRNHVVGTALDETEKRHAAALVAEMVCELNEAQRIADLGSWRLDLQSGRIEWSESMFRLLDVDTTEVPSQDLFFRRVHPDDLARVRAGSTPLAVGSGEPAQIELRIVRRDGSVRDAVLRARGSFDEAGTLTAVHGILQDITERKTLEQEARHAQKMEAVGTLAGGVAHDFNNYLMVLGGNLDLLADNLAALPCAQRSVAAIRFAYDRCVELTEQLLTLSRKRPYRPARFSLAERIETLTAMLRSVLGPTIDLQLSLDREAPPVYADPAQLEHALINLALNARDVMVDGGTLSLSVEGVCVQRGSKAALDGEYYVKLSVKDTGCGIPRALHSRIFEPFFTTKPVGKGTGLGLAMVYGIVRDAGGSIEVESSPGQGATFHLYLRPAANSDRQLRTPISERVPQARGQKVLLVDDVTLVRELLLAQLEQAGYEVLTAVDGVEALSLLAVHRVAAVVSDVVMPNMGGRELARAVQREYPGLPVLLMSGYTSSLADECGDLAIPLLRKPFTSHELRAALAALLSEQEAEAEGQASEA